MATPTNWLGNERSRQKKYPNCKHDFQLVRFERCGAFVNRTLHPSFLIKPHSIAFHIKCSICGVPKIYNYTTPEKVERALIIYLNPFTNIYFPVLKYDTLKYDSPYYTLTIFCCMPITIPTELIIIINNFVHRYKILQYSVEHLSKPI
jgi:hypothetical protein